MPETVNIADFISKHKLVGKEAAYLTEENVSECADAFQLFDKDNSGEISEDEVGAMFTKLKHDLPSDEIRLMIKAVDLDNNGQLSFEEFLLMMAKSQDPDSEVLEAFNTFDADKNGFIEVCELKQAMEKSGATVTEEEAKQMIDKADLDKDGKISFFEFKEMLSAKKR